METILYRVENNVGYITLNIPEKLNALQNQMKVELVELLREIRGDYHVRALVITGEGKGFCAGGDLSAMGDKMKNNDGRERMRLNCDWIKELMQLEKPVIAAVNGYAFGAGLSLALACDIIVCSEKGSFCSSFVNVGLVPDMGCMWNLPKRIGIGKAKSLVFTGRVVKAQEALAIGLADEVVAPEALMETVTQMAEKIAQGPTYTIGLTKALANRAYENSFNNFMDLENNYQASAYHTKDHVIGVRNFLTKGKEGFTGL